jgi:DNA polymerase-3 subunit delta'
VLEEPPPRALLMLISAAPARLLPTLRSRCRHLPLRPLTVDQVAQGAAAVLNRPAEDPLLAEAAGLAEGSIGRALALLDGPTLELRRQVIGLLDRLPEVDPRALHALGDALGGSEPQRLEAFVDTVNQWLAARLSGGPAARGGAIRIAEAWDKINQAARDAATYNLERRPLVFAVFGWLAEATRG